MSANPVAAARPPSATRVSTPVAPAATPAPRSSPAAARPGATDDFVPARGSVPNRTATVDSVQNKGARNQLTTGRITINGNTYQYRSGGHGKGNLPPGSYTVTPHLWNRSDRSMNVGGVGYSFALSDKYDSRVDATRSLLRIHPDGGTPGTLGCIGIVGDGATQARFREDMRAELNRSGGRFQLQVQ